jgi:hypothetical protein
MKYTKFFPSRYLKSEDLDEPRVVVIASVGNEEMEDDGRMVAKFAVKFEDGSTLICNLTNGAAIAAICGSDETDDWTGKAVELFRDRCQFRSRLVACIRVRACTAKTAPQPAHEPLTAAAQPVALTAAAPLRTVPQGLSVGQTITPAQVRMLATVQRRAKVSDDAIHAYLHSQYGITSRKDVQQGDLNDVLAWLEERGAIAELEVGAA